jgi:hypothetical protein
MSSLRQGTALFTMIVVLVGTLVVIQLWLLSAALEGLLTRDTTLLLPAAVASAVLFAVNGGLLLYGLRVDRRR